MAMNKQEVFNKVALHLLKQGVRSQYPSPDGPVCAYRGEDGLMCAVGALIPDEMYSPDMEEQTVSFFLSNFPKTQSLFESDVMEGRFLNRLQSIHDTEPPLFWFDHLWNFAEKHELSTAVLFEKDAV